MASASCWPPRKNKPVEWLAADRLPVGAGNCGTLCGLGVFVDQAAEPVPALNAHTSHSPAIPGAAIVAGRNLGCRAHRLAARSSRLALVADAVSRGSAWYQDRASESDPLTLAEYVMQYPKIFVR